ncbi:MarR family winged helix-turn-helix transcriptional regulator [Rathayibacter tanaceti]|uniref:MarR family protein n=1 Tax=Rathayibacter tanaceti TaxID=1671680 RepID=A0A166HGC4_9MICO|nr:helix-turn-helix domain-containing protein [Rathayibacter tanaceti]KZX20546.1 MarR family protein [Rathayibacter tanaceti]
MGSREAVTAWESLFRAQVHVMRALSSEFPSKEISLNEYDVLFNLTRQPERRARLRDLNKHVLLSQPSVSRLIDRLAARGHVEKSEDPADARGTIIAITDEATPCSAASPSSTCRRSPSRWAEPSTRTSCGS